MTKVSATHISKLLAEAGLPRASAYKTFGRDQDGFIVIAASRYFPNDPVKVAFSFKHERGRVMCEQAREALEARGYTATPRKSNGLGGDYWLDVEKREAA